VVMVVILAEEEVAANDATDADTTMDPGPVIIVVRKATLLVIARMKKPRERPERLL